MKINSKNELREFLCIQNYSGDHPMVIKLPELIKNDGFYNTFLYLNEKGYSTIYEILAEYIKKEYHNDFFFRFEKRKLNGIEYIELSRNVMNLVIEWMNFRTDTSRKISKDNKKKSDKNDFREKIEQVINNPDEVKEFQNQIHTYCLKRGYDLVQIKAEGINKMVIGFGDASVKETSMTLHHLYKVPYIPSTALKGVFHHYCTENVEELEKKYVDWEQEWFGVSNDESKMGGNVLFIDTYLESGKIVGDVFTPHYKSYFQDEGKVYVKDNDKLNPITFNAVEEHECVFQFIFKNQLVSKDLFIEYFKKSLLDISFGAKSSNGYGYFKEGGKR